MKLEIIFDKEFTAVLTELTWSIGDNIKQAMINSVKPAMTEQAPVIYATPTIQQPTQAITPQAPIQQSMPNSVPVKMPENISNSDAVNQFINGQAPTAPPAQPQTSQAPPTQAPQPVPTTPPVQAPTTAPSYDVQKLAVAAMQLKDAGRIGEIQELIAKYGVATIMQLKPEQYDAFAQDLIAKGVKF